MKRNRSWDTDGKANKLYGRQWRKARAAFLQVNHWCAMCEAGGKLESATVVDHITPHKGDEVLFWDRGNWQPLCEWHHNSEKAKIEIHGYSDRLGTDGWPLDPAHPANSGIEPVSGKSLPDELLPIAVPVMLVAGPPASGKTTWCRSQMQPGDELIDFDQIDAEMNGRARQRRRLVVPILRARNQRLLRAANKADGKVFLPMGAATLELRNWWRRKLGNVTVVVMKVRPDECIERINRDPARRARAGELIHEVKRWFSAVEFDGSERLENGAGGTSNHEIEAERTPPPPIKQYLVSSQLDGDDTDMGFA